MLEEQAKHVGTALDQVVNNGLLGALLFLSWVLFFFTARWLINRVKEAEDRTEKERSEHKKTIDTQMADIRNLANVAASVDNLRPMIELLIRQRDGK